MNKEQKEMATILADRFFIESKNPLVNFGKWFMGLPRTKEQFVKGLEDESK